MNKKQYNNVIKNTLKHDQTVKTDDSLATARAIFTNMGVALPQGDMKSVYETIKTNEYMGWRSCTMQEAQEAADNGIAAIGISEDKIIVLCANDEEQPVTQTASVMTLSENDSVSAVDELQYYAMNGAGTYLIYVLEGIQTFSYAQDGDKYLSRNFRVREFRSKDGADEIKIDMDLVWYLQAIRDWAGASVTIRSGYRSEAENNRLGSDSGSPHRRGLAADIVCSGKTPLQVAQKAESLGMRGIEWNIDDGDTHVDTDTRHWFAILENGVLNEDVETFVGEVER